jgi:hypothetical protein
MKQVFTILATLVLTFSGFAQVGINTGNPDASAVLDITSTTAGLLPPRMTFSERNAIENPSQGLIIFCTNCASGEGELQIKLLSAWKNLLGDNASSTLSIGDFYQGGYIFYLDGIGGGLIAAEADQSGSMQWYDGSYTETTATGTAGGTGEANTIAIIDSQGGTAGAYTYAAGICADYSFSDMGVTYDDWFLPSKGELNLMGGALIQLGVNGNFNFSTDPGSYYWSSSEISEDKDNLTAWGQDFYNGGRVTADKKETYFVRAIRAF